MGAAALRLVFGTDHCIKLQFPLPKTAAQQRRWGGQGRTGTVVGCWLIRHGIAESKNALEKIRELRRFETKTQNPSPMTPEQIQMVLHWNEGE